ncbi:hypothetical protein [Sphingomonas sp.]|uniref:RipA family octameric membrane protein n=1 Tax=Sphingomonas sp. TaxID=28214 RepID=UPI001ED51798|nr:hypothetical protein [Sphingomonas sp.]MBX3594278.1 hypothetical protein [Sphingomonas sp.]
MSSSIDAYWDALGLRSGRGAKARREAALKRAYELRSFEIELFWKRATFFFAAQVAMFAALAVAMRDPAAFNLAVLPIAAIGVLTSWLGWLSAQGAKFWQENWERHIDALEDEFEGSLHKIVWTGAGAARFSVSRAQIAQSLCLLIFWLVLAGIVIFGMIAPWVNSAAGRAVILFVAFGYLCVADCWGRETLRSRFAREPLSFHVRTPQYAPPTRSRAA